MHGELLFGLLALYIEPAGDGLVLVLAYRSVLEAIQISLEPVLPHDDLILSLVHICQLVRAKLHRRCRLLYVHLKDKALLVEGRQPRVDSHPHLVALCHLRAAEFVSTLSE